MSLHRPFTATTAIALALSAAAPGWAQTMTPDQAWQQLQAIADQMDLSITTTGVVTGADAVTASGVRIFAEDDPETVVVSMESLRVAPEGTQIRLTPAASFEVAIAESASVTHRVQITHDGSLAGALDRENAALDLDFPSLRATLMAPVSAKGTPTGGSPEMDLTFTGLDATIRAAREGAAELVLDVSAVDYDIVYPDPAGPSSNMISQDGQMEGVRLTFVGTELDMLSDENGMLRAAFDAGFSFDLGMSVGSSRQTSSQMLEGMPLAMDTQGASSTMRIAALDGRVDITGEAGPLAINGSYGPIPGGATLGGMALNFGLPLVTTPEDQPFRYMISLRDMVVSPELLAMVNAGEFAGESLTVTLDVGAQGRLTQELGADIAESDVPPFDISTVSLNDLRVAVGDSALTGSGAVALIGGLMAQIGRPMPNAEGDFTFNLVGGERLLTRLQGMGVIPQDQLFFVRMMMNGLARPVGDDQLQSDVAIRPGGVVTVNGAPLPF